MGEVVSEFSPMFDVCGRRLVTLDQILDPPNPQTVHHSGACGPPNHHKSSLGIDSTLQLHLPNHHALKLWPVTQGFT